MIISINLTTPGDSSYMYWNSPKIDWRPFHSQNFDSVLVTMVMSARFFSADGTTLAKLLERSYWRFNHQARTLSVNHLTKPSNKASSRLPSIPLVLHIALENDSLSEKLSTEFKKETSLLLCSSKSHEVLLFISTIGSSPFVGVRTGNPGCRLRLQPWLQHGCRRNGSFRLWSGRHHLLERMHCVLSGTMEPSCCVIVALCYVSNTALQLDFHLFCYISRTWRLLVSVLVQDNQRPLPARVIWMNAR